MDKIKKYYLLNVKGFDANKMCACTIVFEGTSTQVRAEEKHIYSLIKKHNGLKAGA